MARNILIGLGAGVAAALLYAGPITGSLLAIPLFLIASLPIAIAGLGFGTWSGATGAALAAALIGALLGPLTGFFNLMLYGGPVAWAAHLVGLSRSAEADEREWYPLGAVLLRAALIGAAGAIIAGSILGFDEAAWTKAVLDFAGDILAEGGADAPTTGEVAPYANAMVALVPAIAGGTLLGLVVLNAWLGARIVRMSGLLERPWQPLWSVGLPRIAAPIFGVTLVASFLGGPVGLAAEAVAGAVGFAFALTGYGCLHAYLLGRPGRGAALAVVYLLSFFFGPFIAVAAAVGIADTLMQFRSRRLAGGSRLP